MSTTEDDSEVLDSDSLDGHIPVPMEHKPEVRAIVDEDTMAVYDPDDMDNSCIYSDLVMEVVE